MNKNVNFVPSFRKKIKIHKNVRSRTIVQRRVWIVAVAVTNLTCHEECRGRCFGAGAGQCCHSECVGGCFGAGNKRCWVSMSAVFRHQRCTLVSLRLRVYGRLGDKPFR